MHEKFLDNFEETTNEDRQKVLKFHIEKIFWYKDYAKIKLCAGLGSIEYVTKYLSFKRSEVKDILRQKKQEASRHVDQNKSLAQCKSKKLMGDGARHKARRMVPRIKGMRDWPLT